MGEKASGHSETLVDRVAKQSGVQPAVVEAVFASHMVPPSPIASAPRSLRVLRVRLWGEKRDIPESGPFDTTFELPAGLVMAVAPNLKGKTSLLELITWCLRGTPKELQQDVLEWLDGIECDVLINGVPHGIRLRLVEGAIADATILQANNPVELAAARGHSPAHVRVIARATSNAQYEAEIQALMLDRLGLEPILAYAESTGVVQTHAWPTYFSAVYPPAGGVKVLIGETVQNGLAGRLLEVFLDLPSAALLTRVRTARKRLAAEQDQAADQIKQASARDELRVGEQRQRLDEARKALVELDSKSASAPSVTEIAGRVAKLSLRLTDAQADRRGFDALHRQAQAARQADERRLNNLRESSIARRLFHGLDPQACPRCETPVTAKRRADEANEHQCAVCTSPISGEGEDDVELLDELVNALNATHRAESEASQALVEADSETAELEGLLTQAEADLRSAQQASDATERVRLEREVARAEGALEVLEPITELPQPAGPSIDLTELEVLKALENVLEADLKEASVNLFGELGPEIAALARRFGIHSVQNVKIDRRAALKIGKGGAKEGSFSHQSPGERLRLRIATVIALLRVGTRLGIATHPGLLMLDSLRAEEVQDSDAHAIVKELVGIIDETPGLQMLTTTADLTMPVGRLPDTAVLSPLEGRSALW